MAKLLAAYDDPTWNKLKDDRKRTYRRAASTLIFSWEGIKVFMEALEKENKR